MKQTPLRPESYTKKVALVLQGGGALGSYQAGVYEALASSNYKPDVAVSRARDRVVLVRSVRREELNPNDLKARLIAHFENPMPENQVSDDLLSLCDSGFERDFLTRLIALGVQCSSPGWLVRLPHRHGR